MPAADPARPGLPPRWGTWTATGLALAGLLAAGYLTAAHYTSPRLLACPDTGLVNCARVTTSAQSVVAGVPVAVWGLGYFAVMAALCSPSAWRWPALVPVRLAAAAAGVAAVVYLVYTELFTLDAICLWCTAVHVLTLALFAVVAFTSAAAGSPPH